MPERLTQDQYNKVFGIEPEQQEIRKCALDSALDIRKFEITLYWTRATYFWTFIGAALAGYGAVQLADRSVRGDLSLYLSCVGFLFSFAWYCVNRGSKQWQENWENHVDLLENDITGPLYKTVLTRDQPEGKREIAEYHLVGPAPFSVSKINQITSLYICALWILLYFHALPRWSVKSHVSIEYIVVTVITLVACWLMWKFGRTTARDYKSVANTRTTEIVDPTPVPATPV
jgi:hypothetical protein